MSFDHMDRCAHCGNVLSGNDPYCSNCGALRDPPQSDAAADAQETSPRPETGQEIPETEQAAETEDTAVNSAEGDSVPEESLLADAVDGLIPERELPAWLDLWRPAASAGVAGEGRTQSGPRFSPPPAGPLLEMQRTSRPHSAPVHRQLLLYAAILAAALLSFWLGSLDLPSEPYQWEGVQPAWTAMRKLEPGSEVLVFWQNHPGAEGELNMPAAEVLAQLLAQPVRLHLLSQHPLGLPQARRLLERVRSSSQTGSELPGEVEEIGYWPGGHAILPALAPRLRRAEPDLMLIVTADAQDAIHWLEQAGPMTDAPAIAVTSAGAAPMLRPYMETGQLQGLVQGYSGAGAFASLEDDPLRIRRGPSRETHAAAQNWVTAVLVLAFVAALLLRHYIVPPWGETSRER